jgi:predicted DsbA family dithiol-disulfide isomerase
MPSSPLTTESQNSEEKTTSSADRVMITYYTDPLCCWSWALEPHVSRIKALYGDQLDWNYVMGGMIQDWRTYNDPMNSITRPLQFGPVWMHASQVSGVPMDYSIWHSDPPASSFPSCVAVKCAEHQSRFAGELLLRDLRKAVMTKALNIARSSVIFSVARSLGEKEPEAFNFDHFRESWENGSGADAFTQDLQKTRFLKIGRFPTLTFTKQNARGIMVTGYRPFEVLKEALGQILQGMDPKIKNPSE